MDEIKMVIIEGPASPEKDAVIEKVRKLAGWEVETLPAGTYKYADFTQRYENTHKKILTHSHIGFGAERQYQWGINPFTYAEKKQLDKQLNSHALIIFVNAPAHHLLDPRERWNIKISKENAMDSLRLWYWMELDNIAYHVWDAETTRMLTRIFSTKAASEELMVII